MRVRLNSEGLKNRPKGCPFGEVINFRWYTMGQRTWMVFRVIWDGTKRPEWWAASYFEAQEVNCDPPA
jgi:hypothetical protein